MKKYKNFDLQQCQHLIILALAIVFISLFSVDFISAVTLTENNSIYDYSIDPAGCDPGSVYGFKITPNVDLVLKSINVYSPGVYTSPPTIAYIFNTTDLAHNITSSFNATKSAPFNFNMIAGNNYYVMANSNGSAYDCLYKNAGVTYPIIGTSFNWIAGVAAPFTESNNKGYNIFSLTTVSAASLLSIAVTLNAPNDNTNKISQAINFSSSASIINGNLTNATLMIWNNNGSLYKTNLSVAGAGNTSMNTSIYISSFADNIYKWNVLYCGENSTTNICNFAAANRTLTILNFETNQIYNNITTETSLETFLLNVTFNPISYTSASANLVYNNTKYTGAKTGTGNTVFFTKSLTVPLTDTSIIKQFYWEIILTRTTGALEYYNSSFNNQTINPIIFTYCNATYPQIAVNFSIYDEDNITLRVPATFKASFNYGIGTPIKSASFNLTGLSNYTFCVNTNRTFIVSSAISLTASGYDQKNYEIFQDSYFANNITTQKSLFMLAIGRGTNIVIEVRDTGLQPLIGYIVKIYRYYPEININAQNLIAEGITDAFGNTIADLIQNNVKYRFELYNQSGSLKKTSDPVLITCPSSYCTLPFVIQDTTNYFSKFNNITNYYSQLSFDNVTNTFVFTWNDNTGDDSTHRLFVRRMLLNGSSTVCDTSFNAVTGSLNCSIGSSSASYIAQGFRSVSGTESLIATLTEKIGDISKTFGKDGLFWSFFLLMTLIGVGSWHPAYGIGLYLVGFTGLGLLGIVAFNAPIFIGMLVIGCVFIWAFKG